MDFHASDLADTFGTNIRAFCNFSSECTNICTLNNMYLQDNLSKCQWWSQLARDTPIIKVVY